jgi:hypothetical protein
LKGRNCVRNLCCRWNDIIEADIIAVVINIRMILFGWGLKEVEGFCDYGGRFSV